MVTGCGVWFGLGCLVWCYDFFACCFVYVVCRCCLLVVLSCFVLAFGWTCYVCACCLRLFIVDVCLYWCLCFVIVDDFWCFFLFCDLVDKWCYFVCLGLLAFVDLTVGLIAIELLFVFCLVLRWLFGCLVVYRVYGLVALVLLLAFDCLRGCWYLDVFVLIVLFVVLFGVCCDLMLCGNLRRVTC